LPTKLSQDVMFILMDMLISNMRTNYPELFAKAALMPKTTNLIVIPEECLTVYFKLKHLARLCDKHEKSTDIPEAIEHLHRTHVTIRRSIYFKGKQEFFNHNTYYIPSLTWAGHLNKGSVEGEWHRVKFDEVLVRYFLRGYIAEMNRERLKVLDSGPARKLYSILANKKLESNKLEVTVSKDEITKLLLDPEKRTLKKAIDDLTAAGIITSAQEGGAGRYKSVKVYMFTLTPDQETDTPKPENLVDEFFNMLNVCAESDAHLKEVLERHSDLAASNLKALYPYHPEWETFDVLMPRVILWADMLIHSQTQAVRTSSQKMGSLLATLRAFLKKGSIEEAIPGKFIPTVTRYRTILSNKQAEQKIQDDKLLKEHFQKSAEDIFNGFTPEQQERLKMLFAHSDDAVKLAKDLIRQALELGVQLQVKDITDFYYGAEYKPFKDTSVSPSADE